MTNVNGQSTDENQLVNAAADAIATSEGALGAFTRLLGIKFTHIDNGKAQAELIVRPHLLNTIKIAHGGVTYALADSVSGAAAMSGLGQPVVTQDMHMRYHAPVRFDAALPLMAEANIVHLGSRTIVTDCRVEQNDILVASASATFAILSIAELQSVTSS